MSCGLDSLWLSTLTVFLTPNECAFFLSIYHNDGALYCYMYCQCKLYQHSHVMLAWHKECNTIDLK